MHPQGLAKGRARQPPCRKPGGDIQTAEALKRLHQAREQSLERSLASFGDRYPALNEFAVPRRDIASTASQRRVPLFQRAVVASPMLAEGWFHVEHQPVEPA